MLPTKPFLTTLPLIVLALASGEHLRAVDDQESPTAPGKLKASAVELEAERTIAERVDQTRARDAVRAFVALGARMGGTKSGESSARLLGTSPSGFAVPT